MKNIYRRRDDRDDHMDGAQPTDDEAKIRALENQFAAAVNAKDLDAIMKVYVPDETLLVFDVVPPRQYVGAKAYREDWEDFLALFEITDLQISCRPARLQSLHPACQRYRHERPADRSDRATDRRVSQDQR